MSGAARSAAARRLYAQRRARERHLPAALFGEPAWDMLLDLFAAACAGRTVSTTSACIAASVPNTTALRCLRRLERDGLIERKPHPNDARSTMVALTARAALSIASYLDEAGQR